MFQVGPQAQLTPLIAPATGAITPWSYGVLMYNGVYSGGLPSALFQSSQWAWSADGRYVMPNIMTFAYMDVVGVTSSAPPNMTGAYTPPFVTPPDAATAAVVREMASKQVTTYVARDPSGKRMASFACQPSGDSGKLTVRATASGATVVTTIYRFPTLSSSFGCLGDAEAINWAPDGSRVALTDNQDNQIVIWRLPAAA